MNINHHLTTLALGFLLFILPPISQAAPPPASQPNIIFLLADDQRFDTLGVLGHPDIVTPSLDSLATKGTLFLNAYLTSPICEPSRAGIMLSQHQGTHGSGFDRPTNLSISHAEFANSYPVLLRKHGYFTGFVGKFGFSVADKKYYNDALSPTDTTTERDHTKQLWKLEQFMPKNAFDVWQGFAGQGDYFPNGKDGQHLTAILGDQAIAFIKQASKTSKPFNLSVSFKAPHGPNSPDPAFDNLYKNKTLTPPANYGIEFQASLPKVVLENYRGVRQFKADFQKSASPYYRLIHGVDIAVGRIITALKKLNLHQNTVIIYTSDNGYFTGSKGLTGKDLLYEESLRTPLIIFDPRLPQSRRGQRITQLASACDYAPTMLALASVPIPSTMQGRSLLPLLHENNPPWRDAIFAENFFTGLYAPSKQNAGPLTQKIITSSVRSKAVRSERYKYIRYYELEPIVEELYDLASDPMETRNIATDPNRAQDLNNLRARYDDFLKQTARPLVGHPLPE